MVVEDESDDEKQSASEASGENEYSEEADAKVRQVSLGHYPKLTTSTW